MSDGELAVFVSAFEKTGFTGSINWYRNLDRNWHLLADADPIIRQPTLMIHGARDAIPPSDKLATFVPNVDVVMLDCGHWIQQENRKRRTGRYWAGWNGRRLPSPKGAARTDALRFGRRAEVTPEAIDRSSSPQLAASGVRPVFLHARRLLARPDQSLTTAFLPLDLACRSAASARYISVALGRSSSVEAMPMETVTVPKGRP